VVIPLCPCADVPCASRATLNRLWKKSTTAAGAATVRIVNHVDDEDAPVPLTFTYIEADYELCVQSNEADLVYMLTLQRGEAPRL
jgi:hypothetical protein